MDKEKLKECLALHLEWLKDSSTGKRADLSGADLSGANLVWADLSGANLSKRYIQISCSGIKMNQKEYAKQRS